MIHNDCMLGLPYPPVKAEQKNLSYASLLLSDYAGPGGEMTAVTQYFYQHLIVRDHPDLASVLNCISMVEMHHLDLLGQVITDLGGNPLMRTISRGMSMFWSASNVSPTQNIGRFLQKNIEAEQKAIHQYRSHIKQISDPYLDALLQRIILDEEHHIQIFEAFLGDFTL